MKGQAQNLRAINQRGPCGGHPGGGNGLIEDDFQLFNVDTGFAAIERIPQHELLERRESL